MGNIKPLGSEKLQGDEKIKRILEIAYYDTKPKKTKKTIDAEYITESINGIVYGIVREKDGYYVKKGLNESSLEYIGGMFMKNKNKFKSYGEALKRLNLIAGQETLNEQKKYILKQKTNTDPTTGSPAIGRPEMNADANGSEPLLDDGMNNDVEGSAIDSGDEKLGPYDTPNTNNSEGTGNDLGGDDMSGNDLGNEDLGDEDSSDEKDKDLRSSYMEEIQKFAGKLGQELRDQKERLESDDIKYVLNMIISAIDLHSLDRDDLDDIIERLEKAEHSTGEEEDNSISEPDSEPEPEMEPNAELSEEDDFVSDDEMRGGNTNKHLDVSKYSDLEEDDEPDNDEDDFHKGDKYIIDFGKGEEEVTLLDDFRAGMQGVQFVTLDRTEGGAPYTITLSRFKKILKHKVDDYDDVDEQASYEPGDDESEVLDLDELASEINNSVATSLKKYFQ